MSEDVEPEPEEQEEQEEGEEEIEASDPESNKPPGEPPEPLKTIANKDVVKLLLGNPGVCVVSEEELDAAIAYGDSEVLRRVNYIPSEDDPTYPSYQIASAQFAICLINNKFPALAKNAQNACAIGTSITDHMLQVNNDIDSADNWETIIVGEYESFPKNPNALYRHATRSRGGVNAGNTDLAFGDFSV